MDDTQALPALPAPSPPSMPLLDSDDRPSSSSSEAALPLSSSLSSDPPHAYESGRHPKSKRKRTAAKDKAILEAAYAANPKPDKAARLAIVNRVSLNEKEVQIWFQNRRQNDRRKSRPLSPQEIAALRYGGMQILSSDPPSHNSSFSSDITHTSPTQSMAQLDQGVVSPPRSDPPSSSSGDEVEKTPAPNRESRRWDAPGASEGNDIVTPAPKGGLNRESAQEASRCLSSSVDYTTTNRQWAPSSFVTPSMPDRRENSFRSETFAPPACPSSTPCRPVLPHPDPKSSQLRLSMSLEGKAQVIASIPSPPRPIMPPPSSQELQSLGPVRRLSLQRSYSASSPVTLPPISALTNSLPTPGSAPRTTGRSRDVHAWEFCADAENREDLLTVQAKHESSGSAIAAISLIRSTSANGSPLQPSNSAKRNAAASRAAPRGGMAKKPKLSRASSSAAKLQSTLGLGEKGVAETDTSKTKIVTSSGHDSDKENWSPDAEGNARFTFSQPNPISSSARRPLPSAPSKLDRNPRRTPARPLQGDRSPRSLLGPRSNTAPTYSQARRTMKRGQSPLEIYEDAENLSPSASVIDDEVERFMGSSVSPSKKGDIDAVAGLLSLSQGNWR